MSIFAFLRIIWAHRLVVVASTICCVLGALLVVAIVPPRYEATSRVMLETFKPDPVTGDIIAPNALRVFTQTQAEIIKDYRVATRVVDELGWLTDPGLVRAYQARRERDQTDFRRWAASQVIEKTQAGLVEGSNILEIKYSSPNPEQARVVADAIRQAYVDVSLDFRRESAARSATWFEQQTESAREALNRAESAKTAYERQTGVVLPDGQNDLDSTRLQALAQTSVAPSISVASASTPALAQLGQIDAAISQATSVLGPNHPELQALRAQRAAVAQQAARERAQSMAGVDAGAVDRAVASQRSKVIAQRDVAERLRQLQAEVNLRREQFQQTAGKAAGFRQEAAAADAGLTPLGNATTPDNPAFPNKPLIIIGSLFLGFGLGVGVAVLLELFARRVRCVEDLEAQLDTPVLGVIRATPERKGRIREVKRPGGSGGPTRPQTAAG